MGAATERAERRLSALIDDAAGRPAPVAGRPTSDGGRASQTECADLVRAAVYDAGVQAVDAANACIDRIAPLDDDALAWLALLLVNVPVRDYAWERVDRDVAGSVDLWTDIVRRVEPDLVAAPATLLAFAAWRDVGGAIASIDWIAHSTPIPRIRWLVCSSTRSTTASHRAHGSSAAAGLTAPGSTTRGRHGPKPRRARAVPPGRSIR